ncbi:MAG: carboxypeptidase-like regulatory domain-containing protein [Muribaculaceae bacterium]|nr:carboxypeptidase-like regulatory domain-containing protein [Muribaculaceae bacterium]
MRRSFLIFVMLLTLLPVQAAGHTELEGIVLDALTEEAIAGVVIKSKGVFTSTGKEGKFHIVINDAADSVSFRCVGYENLTIPIQNNNGNNRDNQKVIHLNPKSTQLNDVIVEAPDIYAKGDTLVFNVSRYAKDQDNAIIDVIKRLPGIKVEEDGTIKYQGKPINKFYLDGNDFIGGQYGLATNNISHKDVKAVEVMENHQPIKALEGIDFPEEAGINLKLKEDARSRWVGVANASAGFSPLLYNGSLFTMRIASKIQNIVTIKADNTGWNPANEITEHSFYSMFSDEYNPSPWPEYISADIVNPPLSERRTRDNLSWLANIITAWKRGDISMRLKLNYFADRLDYCSELSTDYFNFNIPTFFQNDKLRLQSHNLSASLHSEVNKKGYYLVDNLCINALSNNSESVITGSNDVTQMVNRDGLLAVNDLKLVKRNEKRLFTLTSRNSLSYHPDCLKIENHNMANQQLSSVDARSTTETELGKLTRFWKFYVTLGLDMNYHRMDCSLTGMHQYDNSGIYDSFTSNIYAFPQVDFERQGWCLSLRVPVRWLYYNICGAHNYFATSPTIHVRRQLSARSELSATISYNLKAPQPYTFIRSAILSDYRNLFESTVPGKYSGAVNAKVSYKFRNPLRALFFNIEGTYSFSRSSVMSNQLFVEDLVISTYADKISDAKSGSIKSSISKGIGQSKMVAGCEVTGVITSVTSMRDYEPVPYRQTVASVSPYFKGSILRSFSLNYEAGYNFSNMRTKKQISHSHSFHQNLLLTFLPSDKVDISAGAEHFLTHHSEGTISNLILIDAKATWRVNSKLRFTLTASNILNQRNYSYLNYGTLSQTEYSFRIRGRNILIGLQYRF